MKQTLDPKEILGWLEGGIEEMLPLPYEGPMGAVSRNNQMAEKFYRVGDEVVRVNVTVAYLPPSELTPNLDLFEE
jgi:hypothetical protein